MLEKLEKKVKENIKILNDSFKKEEYKELNRINLHDYFLAITPNFMPYSQNFQKTFTP